MKKFLLNDPEKWMHQNQAETTGDFVEGCLLDNFIVQCKHGVAALYEHYCNCWSSCYEVHFARASGKDGNFSADDGKPQNQEGRKQHGKLRICKSKWRI